MVDLGWRAVVGRIKYYTTAEDDKIRCGLKILIIN